MIKQSKETKQGNERGSFQNIQKSCIAPEGVYFLGGKIHIVCFYGTPCLVKMSIFIKLAFQKKNHVINYKWNMVFGFVFPLHLPVPFISPTSRRLSFQPAGISFIFVHSVCTFSVIIPFGVVVICVTYTF